MIRRIYLTKKQNSGHGTTKNIQRNKNIVKKEQESQVALWEQFSRKFLN